MIFERIRYGNLNSRQKESYNFHKVASILADFGFNCIKLDDDWQGADFIAMHVNGEDYLKVQLKGRLVIDKKYIEKDIYITFPYKKNWYFYPHDIVMKYLLATTNIKNTKSWKVGGGYSFPSLNDHVFNYLQEYKLLDAV